jgi:CRP-like cAMP-binding protein
MISNINTLIHSGAEIKVYKKKDVIFHEGDQPKYYYQILEGNVTLNNCHEDGTEFIQNFFHQGDSIHESSLFDEASYLANAVANTKCSIYRLEKVKFIELLDADRNLKDLMYQNSAKAIRFLMAKNIVFKDPYLKMLHIIDLLKVSTQKYSKYRFMVPFTRQQLASATGLCVETVIRVIKRIEQNGKIYIINGKVYL